MLTIRLSHNIFHCLLDYDMISIHLVMVDSRLRTAVDSIGLLVGNLNTELLQTCQFRLKGIPFMLTDLLNGHDHLYSIETIKTEIVVEVRLAVKLDNVSLGMCEIRQTMRGYLGSILNLHPG